MLFDTKKILFKGGYNSPRLYYLIQSQIRLMKPFKNKAVAAINAETEDVKLSVFAKPSARKSYQRLFEIAKLNFQTINTPNPIAKLLWEA